MRPTGLIKALTNNDDCIIREYQFVNKHVTKSLKSLSYLTSILLGRVTNAIRDVPYDTKFWREKTLANLANYKQFSKIFLSKIFPFD